MSANDHENLKKQLEWANSKWVILSDKTKREVAQEIAEKYKRVKDEFWKQKAWQLLCEYQLVLGRVINHLQ